MTDDEVKELRQRSGAQILAAQFYLPRPKAVDWRGQPAKASWSLSVVGPPHPLPGQVVGRVAVSAGNSETFRDPGLLNALMWKLGRDESLPRLNAEDGRRILALLRDLAGVGVPHG